MMRRIVFTGWLAAVLCPHLLIAQGTKVWLQSSSDDFEKGRPSSVAIASDGYLEAGPELRSILVTPSTYIWGIASDSQGNAYLATGSPATVLKVSPDGKSTRLFSTKDLSVQAVQVGRDGSVYAATLPSGKVYRIRPGQTNLDEHNAEAVFDPGAILGNAKQPPKYIWDMAFDNQGALYVATGGPAAIYRIRVSQPGSKPELFFSSDEQHIRCLLFEPDGDLVAGTDGTGLVYRINKDGKGIVIYDAPKREVTALAEANGLLYVAGVGEKTRSSLPPLAVEGRAVVTATVTIVTPGSVEASSTNSLIPQGSEIDELNPAGAPHKLWASRDDVVYKLRATPQGLLAATGNRGRIYRIMEDGSYSDLARVASGQATAFASAAGGIYVATSNTGGLYRLAGKPAQNGTYLSDVFDAKLFSTWGRVEMNSNENGAAGIFEIYVRSGNVENPERNWSEWSKVASGGEAKTPAARFVQWKAVLQPGARLGSVGINYLPVNVAPSMDEIVVVVGARVNPATLQQPQPKTIIINLPSQAGVTYIQDGSGASAISALKDTNAITARWAAHDENGDRLVFNIYARGDGERNWRLLKSNLKRTYYSFDSTPLPDGGYRLKIVASDSPSHPPGQGLSGERESEHFIIDTTPPAITPLTAKVEGNEIHAAFEASDTTSPVTRAEYCLDAGPWQYLEPVGRISDSLTEHYDFTISLPRTGVQPGQAPRSLVSDPNEHVLTVRVYDRYENASAAKVVVH